MIRVTTAAVLMLAGAALAQPAITIEVESPMLLPGESTTVTMYAGFDASLWAMGSVHTDFLTSVGSDGWSEAQTLAPFDRPGTSSGSPTPIGYELIVAGQLNFPDHIYADPTNPIAFWQATYTAPIDATAPFDVTLATMTRGYEIYRERLSYGTESHLADLTEGAATIRVIPAPASALVLAMGAVAVRRRR